MSGGGNVRCLGEVWVGLLVCFLTGLAHCENAAVGVAVVMLCNRWF